jgi:hypothetical protein
MAAVIGMAPIGMPGPPPQQVGAGPQQGVGALQQVWQGSQHPPLNRQNNGCSQQQKQPLDSWVANSSRNKRVVRPNMV